jgi:CHAT domain-containing protein/Tfp pilus assembly protein PilF
MKLKKNFYIYISALHRLTSSQGLLCLCAAIIASLSLLTTPAFSSETSFAAGDPALVQKKSVSAEAQSPAQYADTGSREFSRGNFHDAAKNFEEALRMYDRQGNKSKQCETLLMLSQTNQYAGHHRKAQQNLERALSLAKELNDGHHTSAVLGSLGNVYFGMGNNDLALKYLSQGLTLAKKSGYSDVAAPILNNLGNLYVSQKKYSEALDAFRESALLAEKAGKFSLASLATVNAAMTSLRNGKYTDAQSLVEKAVYQLHIQEDSYSKAYSLINAGLVFSDLRTYLPDHKAALLRKAYAALIDALTVAEKINDLRTASYAYGYLGKLYEDEGQYTDALEFSRRAVFTAQQKNATEALYRWNWQCGRILHKMGKIDEAILSYRKSLHDLNAVRDEMSSCYANPDASYRKTASAVCVELVKLLLQRASTLQKGEAAEPYLIEARETLEVLKVFELREYFKDDCIDAAGVTSKKLDEVSEKAVVIYPILLGDRVELLASFSGRLKRFTLPVGIDALGKEAAAFRRKLEKRTTWEFMPHARKLYDWIIRPLEKDLEATKPDTLVFVPDGPLRMIPMTALHDGRQFLINRYPIAITPSLNLADPKPMKRENAKVLAMGLTEPVQGFPGLPYVSSELKAIQTLYGGQFLLNEQFRVSAMEKELKKEPFGIVHIASHGSFGGTVDKTFILAFDERFSMERFGEYVGLFRFRDEPLELLTLSACETAAGDEKAALGLAGVAVRAGARSAVATLWHVNDPASYELIVEFYKQLQKPSVSRASALQAAQLKMMNDLRYDHPGYWAPFLLINNWL